MPNITENKQTQDFSRTLKLKDGTIVPGATKILKQLSKDFLITWANNLGKKGIDYNECVSHSAVVGDIIHTIIQSHLLHIPVDISTYDPQDLLEAEKAFNRYMEWEKQHTIEFVEVEKELVSETYKFGGYLDIYCRLDGEWTIIDIKTSKKIYEEQKVQVSSYEQLVRENNLKVDRLLVLNTGKLEDSVLQVEEISKDQASKYFKAFKVFLDLYYTRKEIGWKD